MAGSEMGEKGEEPKTGRNLWTQNHTYLLITIVAVISAAAFGEYELDKLTTLKTKVAKQEGEIHDLTKELSPFRVYAVREYGEDEKWALTQLAEELKGLEKHKGIFRPLEEPVRKKTVAAFRAVQTKYGKNQIHVELIAEPGSTNRSLIIDEWVSILREAGFDAFVGRPEVTTLLNPSAPLWIGYSARETNLMWSFMNTTVDEFVNPLDLWTTNNAQMGRLTVHLIGEPIFSADGHVTFKGYPVAYPPARPRGMIADLKK